MALRCPGPGLPGAGHAGAGGGLGDGERQRHPVQRGGSKGLGAWGWQVAVGSQLEVKGHPKLLKVKEARGSVWSIIEYIACTRYWREYVNMYSILALINMH